MYTIIDFIDNAFRLKDNKSIPVLHDFYNFCQSIEIENLEKIREIINLPSLSRCYVLLLFGYITPEAEEEIKKRLKIN